jgi:hypothetical protein
MFVFSMVLFGTFYCNQNLFSVVSDEVKNYIDVYLTRKSAGDNLFLKGIDSWKKYY